MTGEDNIVVFVCQHGAFRSRIAAAYFNQVAPPGWRATSAGVTAQAEVSERLRPLLAGTVAAKFVDDQPPRPLDEAAGSRIIAIDTEVAGADIWRTGGGAPLLDEELRDEIGDRVRELARDLSGDSEAR